NGCTTSDELTVYTYNITTDSLINPFPYESCDALSSEPVRIEYINNSKDTLLAGESLSFSYSINSGSLKSGSYILTEPLYPDSVGEFEFTQKANLLESITYEFTIISRKTTNDADTDDALIKDVNINAPIVSLGSDIVYFTGSTELSTTEIYESYLWSTGETSSSIIVTESGEYSVEVENFDGCTGTASIEAFNTTGIDNVVQGEDYKITYFPNPATEKLNLVFENKKNTDILIEIININGQVMYNNKLSNVLDEVKQIDVNPFTSGVYFIRFRINDEYYLKKLIIQ
ncbi:MAG: T9SS type A sorting domain-containing protein, partial [Bacteroidales bacterium]|nr:T9SS type A sorting domain-containing protein [Bacteroidales bacterium]